MKTPAGQSTIGYLIADLSRLFGRVFDRRAAQFQKAGFAVKNQMLKLHRLRLGLI